MVTKIKQKISFCTVCMNRLSFLKETLPKNIEDNLDYGNLEFIVLNYNSADEIDEWINTEMSQYIELGVLKYIKTTEPKYFLRSHSKNVVSKQASGNIICNVDADNFIGKGFAEFINESFCKDQNSYLFVDKNTEKDCCGRICLTKEDFITLRGYDEEMKGYGFEDFDLRNRLELLGRKVVLIPKETFLNAITHSDTERLQNEYNNIGIKHVYIKYKTPAISELVYCFDNNEVYTGNIIDNFVLKSESIENLFPINKTFKFRHSLLNDKWEYGEFISLDKIIFKEGNLSISNNPDYIEISDKVFCSSLIMFFSQISNRIKMEKNLTNKRITVNEESYGDAHLE
ncbi:glycosyltransferase family 2 protein [Flavobacterium daemonense]|uniref:glycosyltransferase family 2 protein n=1 Tax=Flavobacterium daemonense TaxID=1393049 RepID=UPI001184A006|nr:glycosyltransferase family A protein [Flavobacterium daemonense]KAF2329079.1 glycosyltransferase family 2 protein [Flavobacterium daemonense]